MSMRTGHIVGATQVNDLRFTFNDRVFHNISAGLGGGYPTKLGLKGVPDDAFPTLAAAGFSTLGAGTQERRQYPIQQQQQYPDNYAWTKGRHAMKFGFEVRRSFNQDVLRTSVSGSFSFSTQPTALPGNTTTGNGLATMLTGFDTGFSELQTQPLLPHTFVLVQDCIQPVVKRIPRSHHYIWLRSRDPAAAPASAEFPLPCWNRR